MGWAVLAHNAVVTPDWVSFPAGFVTDGSLFDQAYDFALSALKVKSLDIEMATINGDTWIRFKRKNSPVPLIFEDPA